MEISDILKEELETLKTDIIARHEQSGQVASGDTKASFNEYLTSGYSGVLEGAAYVGVLERGRRAGKVPYDFKDILQRWAQAKGLAFSTQADFNRFAYFVTKKIREEGTELYRTGKMHNNQEPDIFTTPIAEFTERLSSKVAIFFETEIKKQI